ncbi:GDSL-type esterase/lipase family protein [Antrihabitans stalactiti]|nr:GDSL-type esterase/lipase family protein [Antrihabitans stalactiti]
MTMRSSAVLVAAFALLAVGSNATPVAAAPNSSACESWVAAFTAAPGVKSAASLQGSTIRAIVSPHVGSDTLRLRLTNRFGSQPLTVGPVEIGRSIGGSANLVAGSNTVVTFGGSRTVTIPAGADLTSDPISLRANAFELLAVSFFLPVAQSTTEHFDAMRLSWMAPNVDATGAENASAFLLPYPMLPVVAGLDAVVPGGRTVVAFGDSITDGAASFQGRPAMLGTDERYPDFLARRLLGAGHSDIGVVNAGISGNQASRDGNPVTGPIVGYGPAGVSRFEHDVLEVPGVTDVIVMLGTNDMSSEFQEPATPQQVIDALATIVAKAHAAGVRVQLGTIPPRQDAQTPPSHPAGVLAVNRWIREESQADSVIDFNAVLRDPGNPSILNPGLDSGDGVHPNAAGYRAMADAVDLTTLVGTGRGC